MCNVLKMCRSETRKSFSNAKEHNNLRSISVDTYPYTTVTTFLNRNVIKFPSQLERQIQLKKTDRPLGITLDTTKYEGINGCVVTSILCGGAAERDGRIFINDYIVSINNEYLRGASPAKVMSVLRRSSLIHGFIDITYMSHKDTSFFEEHFVKTIKQISTTKSLSNLPTLKQRNCCIDTESTDEMESCKKVVARVKSDHQFICRQQSNKCVDNFIWSDYEYGRLLKNENNSYGVDIVGGKLNIELIFPDADRIEGIFVKDVYLVRLEDTSTSLKPGDRILQINESDIQLSHNRSTTIEELFTDSVVTVKFQSLLLPLKILYPKDTHTDSGQSSHVGQLFIDSKVDNVRKDTLTQLPIEAENLDLSTNECQLPDYQNETEDHDTASSTHLDFITEQYRRLSGELLEVQVNRTSPDEPIGLALVCNNQPNRIGAFICGIFPGSAADKCKMFNLGDKIIEVNDVPLCHKNRGNVHGKFHYTNATPLLKSIKGNSVRFIIYRSSKSINWLNERTNTTYLTRQNAIEICGYSNNVSNDVQLTNSEDSIQVVTNTINGQFKEERNSPVLRLSSIKSPAEEQNATEFDKSTDNNQSTSLPNLCNKAAALQSSTKTDDVEIGIQFSDSLQHPNSMNQLFQNNEKAFINRERLNSQISDPNDPSIRPVLIGASSVIEIDRQEKSSLGITIIGGYGSHLGAILIHSISVGGQVHRDGRLAVGDQILEVDDNNVESYTCEEVLKLLLHLVGRVRLKVIRIPENVTRLDDDQEKLYKIHIELVKKQTKGFGFSIMERHNGKGAFVSNIIDGGSAEKNGHLIPGDFLLELNGKKVFKVSYDDILYMLKTHPLGKLNLVVGRLRPYQSAVSNTKQLSSNPVSANNTGYRHHQILRSPNTTVNPNVNNTLTQSSKAISGRFVPKYITSPSSIYKYSIKKRRSCSAPQRFNQSIAKRATVDKSTIAMSTFMVNL